MALLVSCQEVPSSQPKPIATKGKTAKELLCKRWRLTDRIYNNPYPYTAKDTFGITFYEDDTFVFRTDPAWYLYEDSLSIKGKEESLVIRGKWKFLSLPTYPPPNPNPSQQICEKEPCVAMPILLETSINSDASRKLSRLFNISSGNVFIHYLTKDTLCIASTSAVLPPIVLRLKTY